MTFETPNDKSTLLFFMFKSVRVDNFMKLISSNESVRENTINFQVVPFLASEKEENLNMDIKNKLPKVYSGTLLYLRQSFSRK